MSDNREPEVTGAPSADARSVEAVVEAVAGARGPANFTRNKPTAHCGSMICLYYYRKNDSIGLLNCGIGLLRNKYC